MRSKKCLTYQPTFLPTAFDSSKFCTVLAYEKKNTVEIPFKLLILTCVTKFLFQMHKITSFKIKCLLKDAPNILVESFLGLMYCNGKREDFFEIRYFLTV